MSDDTLNYERLWRHLTLLTVEAHATTWRTTLGTRYRKTRVDRLLAEARLTEACVIAGDHVGLDGLTSIELRAALVDKLLHEGVLVRLGPRELVPWNERDRTWVRRLRVRTIAVGVQAVT